MTIGVNFEKLTDPGERYAFGDCLGAGVFGTVLNALDSQAGNKKVAIKVQKYTDESKGFIEEEYKILRDFTNHLNLVDFYGIFKRNDEIWFVLELCEGGPVIDLVNVLLKRNRRMVEEHIAYVLKEVVRALIYLHENNVVHRDVKCSNILLTKDGEVKLIDFGLSTKMPKQGLKDRLGSAAWMAPEVAQIDVKYDLRADVWSVGMAAIELGDGRNPFQEMNPSRALFQIVRNPPPTLYRPSNWSMNYNDFISECLEKNCEYRPCMMEIIEHPFLQQIPDNNYHMSLEIKALLNEINNEQINKCPEIIVKNQFVKTNLNSAMEKMRSEDLAALDKIDEETVIKELEERFKCNEFHTFIGDVLLILNPNEKTNIYDQKYHRRYCFKSRSENFPHIYAIADTAYQNALHHAVPQKIILSGESGSGKTTNYLHVINHLLYLGENPNINSQRIRNCIKLVHSLTHASTPLNDYSTRCLMRTNIFFGQTGKITAAEFNVYLLEKFRISSVDMCHSNFHILYYVYDGLKEANELDKYKLNSNREYRYLRVNEDENSSQPRNNIGKNIVKYRKIMDCLKEFDFREDHIEIIHVVIAAILNLGDVKFQDNDDFNAEFENKECIDNVAELLSVDSKKLVWALTNYCVMKNGVAVRKNKSADEARSSRDVLANILYTRLVDYVINLINQKLAIGKSIFGNKYSVKVFDYFGFECFQTNHLSQLFVNCLNEQLQYHYLQRFFGWEMMDVKGEDIEYTPIDFYDNKNALDGLLGKPEGVLSYIDEVSKKGFSGKYVLDYIQHQENSNVTIKSNSEFSIAHYTGKVTYSVKEMPDKNRDYLPPEIIETLRLSQNPSIQIFFTNKLDKTGNLLCELDENKYNKRFSFLNAKKISDEHHYSQTRKIRTSAAVFRAVSLDLLRDLSTGSGSGGTHIIRCIQTNLKSLPNTFHKELIRQQLRALAITTTAKARQRGYSCRISFSEFLRRYQFLAFDFNETVDMNRENCRLLLIRLKMEGWSIGKTKVFLKYYNEEHLARLYEVHVKKIIKIQSILRRFLAKCRLSKKTKEEQPEGKIPQRRRSSIMTEEEAAEIIQKAYRKTALKRIHELSLQDYEMLTEEQYDFIKPFAKKWKTKTIFYVLLQYRARRIQDSFNFAQQVHLYNLNAFHELKQLNEQVNVDEIDRKATVSSWLGEIKPTVTKIAFRLEDLPIYDTSNMLPTSISVFTEKEESWDTPYRWKESKSCDLPREVLEQVNDLGVIPYQRDSEESIKEIPPPPKETFSVKQIKQKENENRIVYQKNFLKNTEPVKKFKEPEENFISNSKPANKDFDYIKGIPVKPKSSADPIAELKNIVRRSSLSSEDDPPFNFKGMLRKTNFQKESIKKVPEIKVTYELPKKVKSTERVNGEVENGVGKFVRIELGPGIVLTGTEVEL